jgi:preprotein translocase subunit SecB
MNASPLQLDHYFFAEAHCKASPEPPDSDDLTLGAADPAQFRTEIRMYKGESDPDTYQIQLVVKSADEVAPKAAYELMLHVIGYFRVDPDYEHEHLEHLVQINGASVLYSAARDFVLTLTSRGPWGPLMLPTVNFRIGQGKPADAVTGGD